ncbi:MAG: exodeoxyribonuclease V subunit gamma, partial [Chlorobium sp.]|nr:exodeoxyribonuclease V subunit gamma [Chlorobium sp.]
GDGTVALHYSIADRRMMNEGEIASALLKLLALPGSRLAASEMFDLLASPPVSRRFSLDLGELELIRGWIEKSGIRWGMDEGDRTSRNLPAYRDNSWRAGLDRLLLGYAMPDENQLFNGILPYDDMSGSVAESLGKFAEFIERVDRFVKSFERSRTLAEWRVQFQAMLADFIAPSDSSEREFAAIAELAEELGNIVTKAEFTGNVSPAVMLSWLRARLEHQEQGLGFMTGGITFCAMLPMRSIPFRVVVLIGMNDNAFPRQSRAPGFDLIAREPQRGDRSLRNEDRYLFLESLLSARDLLYISYVGQSIRDNSELPPSVLVSELLDAVRRGFSLPDSGLVEEHLVVRHRLQAFNREYFTAGSPLFSYSAENYRALVEKESAETRSHPFMNATLAEPPEEWKTLSLERLLRF